MKKDIKRKLALADLTLKEKKWLAKAVASIILTERVIDEKETVFLNKLKQVMVDVDPIDAVLEVDELLMKKKKPKIEPLKIEDPEKLILMLNTMITAILADEEKHEEEVRMYIKAGVKLGMTYDILLRKLHLRQDRLRIKKAQVLVDKDIRELVAQRNWYWEQD